jgi:hypothetical protein
MPRGGGAGDSPSRKLMTSIVNEDGEVLARLP